jgi:tetratricopeptide (TPR) repeat protein
VHEDDAERAVRAGLAILDGVVDLNVSEPGLDLSVRIGIETGEAVVSLGARAEVGEGIVTGDAVNTASRLQGVAPVNGIAVGEGTRRATDRVIDYERLDPVTVKGKAEPVLIWRALTARSRLGSDLIRTHATPLVGRDLERTLLVSTFERAARDRAPHLVTVVGEPGVGKSRLVSELAAHIDEREDLVVWRHGRCLPYGDGITFWALGEIVKAHAGILDSDPAPEVKAKLEASIDPNDPDGEWLLRRMGPLVGLDSEETPDRDESFAAWRRYLERIAEDRPTVLVFEDIHWADAAFLAFLEHLAEWSQGVALLMVATARPELFERHAGWGAGMRNVTTIDLPPLTEAETARLVTVLLESAILPADVQSLILDRAGGNPLYAEEFVRMLEDRGLLVARGRTWTLADAREVPVPDTIQALIAARLDTLAPERKALLEDAAVLGKVFWAGAIAAMGGREEAEVRTALHELSRKELVRPSRESSMGGAAEYAFWHALVRDVAYGRIPRPARARKHLAAAAWIERAAGEAEDLAEILVHHYGEAVALLRAAGQSEGLDAAIAGWSTSLALAARRATSLDMERAVALFERAIEATPTGMDDRARLLYDAAWAMRHVGRLEDEQALLEEALSVWRADGEIQGTGEALARLAGLAWQRGDAGLSDRLSNESSEAFAALPTPEGQAQAALTEAMALQSRGIVDRQIECLDRAVSIAESEGLAPLLIKALDWRGSVLLDVGDPGGLTDMRHAVDLATGVDSENLPININNLADRVWRYEGPLGTIELCRTALAITDRRRDATRAAWVRSTLWPALFDVGEWDEAMRLARETSDWCREHGFVFLATAAEIDWASPLLAQGNIEEAGRSAASCLERARAIGDIQCLAPAIIMRARAAAWAGKPHEASDLVVELEEMTAPPGHRMWRADQLVEIVRVCAAAERMDMAESFVQAEPVAARHRYALLSARAAVAEATGNYLEAVDLHASAEAAWRAFPRVYEEGQALLGRGRCLMSLRRPSEAVPALGSARQIFAPLRAAPALEETDALLQQALAKTS